METTLPLDRLITTMVWEHHEVQANVNDMLNALEDGEPITLENLTNISLLLRGQMEKLSEAQQRVKLLADRVGSCLLYTSPSPRDNRVSRMPSSA